jgi:hypothetical protein
LGLAGAFLVSAFERVRGAYRGIAILVLNTLLMLLLAEAAAQVFFLVTSGQATRFLSQFRPARTEPSTHPWFEDLMQEQATVRARYWPFVGWRAQPRPGPLMTIGSDGNRVVPGASCETGAYRVLVLGGSTVFGFGVPDWGTLPAYLQQALASRLQRPICVRNLGQLAWSSTQDAIALLRELQDGERPDLVIFYQGYNDVTTGGNDGVGLGTSGGVDYDGARAQDEVTEHTGRTALAEFLRGTGLGQVATGLRAWLEPAQPDPPSPLTPESVLRAYSVSVDAARGLADAAGAKTWFFWQPTILTRSGPVTPSEMQVLSNVGTAPSLRELVKQTYAEVEREAGNLGVVFLGHLFDTPTKASVYMDECHLWPEGNAAVAERIVMSIAADLPLP